MLFFKVVPKYYKVLREKDDASCQEFTEQLNVFDSKLAELKTPFFAGTHIIDTPI